MQAYSNPIRESDSHALPDVEIFYLDEDEAREMLTNSDENDVGQAGWYYWFCFPGCLPDSDPYGPFETEEEALAEAQSE